MIMSQWCLHIYDGLFILSFFNSPIIYQLLGIIHEPHSHGSKTLISRIQDNKTSSAILGNDQNIFDKCWYTVLSKYNSKRYPRTLMLLRITDEALRHEFCLPRK